MPGANVGWFAIPLFWPTPAGTCACGRGHDEREVGKAPLVAEYQVNHPEKRPRNIARFLANWLARAEGYLERPGPALVAFDEVTR
jgi:hypothetical protein